jgi:hypothetical protein
VSPHSHERRVRSRKTGMRRKPGTEELAKSQVTKRRTGNCTTAEPGKTLEDRVESSADEALSHTLWCENREYRVASETKLKCGISYPLKESKNGPEACRSLARDRSR